MPDANHEARENLKLPPTANKLWRRAGWRIAALLMERGCAVTLGGGTVLAARWGGHRQSFDIDFRVPAADAEKLVEAAREPEIRRFIERAGGRANHGDSEPGNPWTVTFPDTGAGRTAQRVAVFAADPVPRHGARTARVQTRELPVASTTQILAGKLRRVGANVPRDLFDLVTAETMDPEALTAAVNTLPENTIRKAGSNWVASRNEITRNSLIHITGVDAETMKGFPQLAERAATACSNAVYERVRADRSPEGVAVRYRTKGGREGTRQLRTGSMERDLDSHGLRAWILHRGTAGEAKSLADTTEALKPRSDRATR